MNEIEKIIPNKPARDEYEKVCNNIWGCVPIDVNWAKQTDIYQKELVRIRNEEKKFTQ